MKKILLLFIFILILPFQGCGSDFKGGVDEDIDYSIYDNNINENSLRVGVAMPTKDLQRWRQDAQYIENGLKEAGFKVDCQVADNDVDKQIEQITGMIESECDALVIAAIDGGALTDVLTKAKEKQIPVIAYDRLIMNTDAVSYYVSFDNALVGTLQGEYIEKSLDLKNAKGPFHIELFAGSPDDNNSIFYYNGAMDILQPYIDSGKLIVTSKEIERETCSIKNWSTETAQKRMEQLLDKYYKDGTTLDAVLSPNDSIANGITAAITQRSLSSFPILTGQDCDINSVKNIINDTQSMSVYKDTRISAQKTVEMVSAILSGKEVEINDTSSYNNGIMNIPAYLCEPIFADKNNYEELLIDSGYYTKEQLQ